MTIDRAFVKVTMGVFAAIVLVAIYPLAVYGTRPILEATIAAAVIGLLHLLSGVWAIEYSFDKPPTTFLKVVLGSMGIRLVVMCGLFFLLIQSID